MKRAIILLLFFVLLCGCRQHSPEDAASSPGAPDTVGPVSSEAPANSFPPQGPLLKTPCSASSSMSDSTDRQVTVWWRDKLREFSYSFDLTSSPPGDPDLLFVLERNPNLRAFDLPSRPVDESGDQSFLLELIDPCAFVPVTGDVDLDLLQFEFYLVLTAGSEKSESQYYCFSDGRIVRVDPTGSASTAQLGESDFAHLFALDYKYNVDPAEVGAQPDEFWLADIGMADDPTFPEDVRSRIEALAPDPFPENYMLCISSETLHLHLDRSQAQVLLSALFGGSDAAHSHPDMAVASWDRVLSQEGICLAEYLDTSYTTQLWSGDTPVMKQTFYLYPDGTLLRLPADAHAEHFIHNPALLRITPSWPQGTVAEHAFSWDTLITLLSELQ